MLLDVNALVALAWPNHVHHDLVRRWFERQSAQGWATCPLTESGFIRVSSNSAALPHAVSPIEAIELLRRLRGHGTHSFLRDDVSLVTAEEIDQDRIVGHRQVTDAHLLVVAMRHNSRLVTLDRRVRQLLSVDLDLARFLVELGGTG